MVKKLTSRRLSLVVFAAILALPLAARADDAPMKIRYEGSFTPPELISFNPLIVRTTDKLGGNGTHLGRFTGSYPHTVNFTAGTFSGTATFTAANGDQLFVQLGGTGVPTSETTWAVDLTGTILGGTGRFVGATGTLRGTGTVDLAKLTTTATLLGTINKEDLSALYDEF